MSLDWLPVSSEASASDSSKRSPSELVFSSGSGNRGSQGSDGALDPAWASSPALSPFSDPTELPAALDKAFPTSANFLPAAPAWSSAGSAESFSAPARSASLADDGLGMLGELDDGGLGMLGELDDGGLGMLGELGDDGLGMLGDDGLGILGGVDGGVLGD